MSRPGASAPLRALFAALLLLCAAAVPAQAQLGPGLDGASPAQLPTVSQMQASQEAVQYFINKWEESADIAEEALSDPAVATGALEILRQTLVGDRESARLLADRLTAAIDPLRNELDTLQGPQTTAAGDAAPPAAVPPPPEVRDEIEALTSRILTFDAALRLAERAYQRADALIGEIDDLARARRADQLSARGPSPFGIESWTEMVEDFADLAQRISRELVYNLSVQRAGPRNALIGVFGVAFAIGLGIYVRGKLLRFIAAALGDAPNRLQRLSASALSAVAGVATPLLGLGVAAAALQTTGALGPAGRLVALPVAAGLVLAAVGRTVTGVYFSPGAPAMRISALDDAKAAKALASATLVIFTLAVHVALLGGGAAARLREGGLVLASALLLTVAAVGVWRLARFIRPDAEALEPEAETHDEALAHGDDEQSVGMGRTAARLGALGLRLTALAAVVLAWAGYAAASELFLYSPVLTLGLAALGLVLFQFMSDGVEIYIEDSSARGAAADRDGLRLIPLFLIFVLACAALPVLALIWGAQPADIAEAWRVVVSGVQVGDIRISFVDVVTFIVVFGVGYTATRLFQSLVRATVLPKTRLDVGARSAVVSGMGYIGFTLALLLAVGATGLDLSNLAIVAGALSVGIGFGLQTIVNNFVSGIILLIERPVKVGDWIDVGGTHGTVRRISVRATQIETFDRSTLILPNSELISGRVVNYTHGNSVGRVIIKVGVAYGSDVRQVESVLKEAAAAESRALRYPPAQVLFMGFGADSLDFEVRLILRDIGNVLAVTSDMHFEIERRFR
ncbi:MAG: DUF3772 domain-containing protein, partial [Pseudomonadota bacterium]